MLDTGSIVFDRSTICVLSLRKEVIQPHFPVRLPCYDFTPLTRHTFGAVPPAAKSVKTDWIDISLGSD